MKNIKKKTYPIIEEAFNEYYSVILYYIICRVKYKQEAEDLVQDVFVRLREYPASMKIYPVKKSIS